MSSEGMHLVLPCVRFTICARLFEEDGISLHYSFSFSPSDWEEVSRYPFRYLEFRLLHTVALCCFMVAPVI